MHPKFSIFTVAAMPLIPIALACGGDDGGGGKIMVKPDAAKAIDAAPVVCTASTSYSSPAGSDQFAGEDGSGSDYSVYWLGKMDATTMPDFLQLTLYAGYGAFSSGTITPMTIQLTGEELAYETCGACIFLFTDLHRVGSDVEVTDYYMPTGGTVQLTNVSGSVEGMITNLQLQHMVISGQELLPANDGCNSTISSISMNAMFEGSGSGSGSAWGKPTPDGRMSFRFKLGNRTF